MQMEVLEIRDSKVTGELLELWRASVRATHHFLTEEDILRLRPMVKHALKNIETLVVSRDRETWEAFLGVETEKIEMLFIHPEVRGKGLGKRLVQYAVEELGIRYVDVNEQNEQGVGFYLHLGFTQFGRSAVDSAGNPFPILHLQLK